MIEIAKTAGVLGMAVGTFFLIVKRLIPLFSTQDAGSSYKLINRIIVFAFMIAVIGLLVVTHGIGNTIEAVGEVLEDPDRSLKIRSESSTTKTEMIESMKESYKKDLNVISFLTYEPQVFDSVIHKIRQDSSDQFANFAKRMIKGWSDYSHLEYGTPQMMGEAVLLNDSIDKTWVRRIKKVK